MTPYHADDWLTLYQGDVRDVLRDLPAASVHCAVTSPPYWGLRDYGAEGQLGLEPTPDAYIAAMVDVFREVRRVLRDDGTLWLNMGDSYAASGMGGNPQDSPYRKQATNVGSLVRGHGAPVGTKPKDLLGMPWRLAFALQADGWYLRSDIVWAKPNPMPESVRDRPTRSHEYIFLLSKSARYHYDAEAVREPATTTREELNRFTARPDIGYPGHSNDRRRNGPRALGVKLTDAPVDVRASASARMGRGAGWRGDKQRAMAAARPDGGSRIAGLNDRWDAREAAGLLRPGRNLRDVWTIPSQPYPGAHFATFPERLVEPCIKAGTSERGVCPECGAPWRREVVREGSQSIVGPKNAQLRAAGNRVAFSGYADGSVAPRFTTTGWRPGCDHDAGPVPAVVLDPFAGSGTIGLVAERLGRRSVLIELSPDYCGQLLERVAAGRRDGTGAPVDLPLPVPEGSLWEAVG